MSLEKIADATGTPVYVYSANAFLEPLRRLRAGLEGLDCLICFAVKSNSNLSILRMLNEAGAGMDIVSGGELFRAMQAGVHENKIVFSGVGKTPGEIAAALEHGEGIFSFNVESAAELETINAVAIQLGKTARVALRFNPDVNAKTHPYISTGLRKNKFGLDRREVLAALSGISKNPRHYRGITVRGIGIHIGSQLLSLSPLDDAFGRLRSLLEEIRKKTPNFQLEYVDLGGGVGIAYAQEKAPKIEKYCALVRKYFSPERLKPGPALKILLEPGRLLSGNSGVLLTEVLYRKSRPAKDFLIVDAAMNDLLRPSLYGSHHEIAAVEKSKSQGATRKTDVVGPVCETGDSFGERKLSAKIGAGDLVAILSSGAYGFTMSSNYNSRPRPPEVLVRDGKFEIIRERESYQDLVRGEKG